MILHPIVRQMMHHSASTRTVRVPKPTTAQVSTVKYLIVLLVATPAMGQAARTTGVNATRQITHARYIAQHIAQHTARHKDGYALAARYATNTRVIYPDR